MDLSRFLFLSEVWTGFYLLLYVQLFSRLFGLSEKIDRQILLALHVTATAIAGFISWKVWDLIGYPFIELILMTILLIILEGLVWQLFLKERKLNGFLTALLCNVVYMWPICLFFYMWLGPKLFTCVL